MGTRTATSSVPPVRRDARTAAALAVSVLFPVLLASSASALPTVFKTPTGAHVQALKETLAEILEGR